MDTMEEQLAEAVAEIVMLREELSQKSKKWETKDCGGNL
jgi:hypothetical protein